jgi:hypothetical protein
VLPQDHKRLITDGEAKSPSIRSQRPHIGDAVFTFALGAKDELGGIGTGPLLSALALRMGLRIGQRGSKINLDGKVRVVGFIFLDVQRSLNPMASSYLLKLIEDLEIEDTGHIITA